MWKCTSLDSSAGNRANERGWNEQGGWHRAEGCPRAVGCPRAAGCPRVAGCSCCICEGCVNARLESHQTLSRLSAARVPLAPCLRHPVPQASLRLRVCGWRPAGLQMGRQTCAFPETAQVCGIVTRRPVGGLGPLCSFLAVWSSAGPLTSRGLCFFICKVGTGLSVPGALAGTAQEDPGHASKQQQ